MYALILAEVKGCVRNRETVLTVFQSYLLTAVEHSLDGTFAGRAHQLVVNLQVTESQWNVCQCVDIRWVEHCDTIRSSKHQTTVG